MTTATADTATLHPDGVLRDHSEQGRRETLLPPPHIQNHAANLTVLPDGSLACVWFSGTQEGVADISVWFSRLAPGGTAWTDPVQMSDAMWTLLGSVNTTVNRSIKALSDDKAYSKEEFWTFPDGGTGDCEDYVLLKRKMLHAQGIPLSDLLITVVRQKNGEGHAVLTVRTGDGDLILDNLNDDVKPWTQTGYHFMKRQSVRYTGRWVSILDDRDVLVSSVN